jgi:hypothetical protein
VRPGQRKHFVIVLGASEAILFEFMHESRHPRGGREHETTLADIDLSVLAGPHIDAAEPLAMNLAEIFGREAVISSKVRKCPFSRLQKAALFGAVHFKNGANAQQVAQHSPIRSRFISCL